MEDCVFCKIIAGDIPSTKVYEDANSLAFITIEAINPGHVLVIPKTHSRYFYKMDDHSYEKLMLVVKKVAEAIELAFTPKRVSLMTMGDEVPHTHVHVVPVNESSDVSSKKLMDKTVLHPDSDERQVWADKIRVNL